MLVDEYLDINSPNLVVTDLGAGQLTFSNYGTVSVTSADSWNYDPSLYGLTGEYEFSGYGTLGGSIVFESGTLDMYYNSSLIAELTLTGGTGSIDTAALPNGQISLTYTFTSLVDGYFFTEDEAPLILGSIAYTTTNASLIANPNSGLSAKLLGMAGMSEDELDEYDFFLSSNGQFRIDPIPVPSAFLLLGSGIIGLIGFRRKKQLKLL